MLNSKQILKKRLHIAIPICLFFSLYFPSLLTAILSREQYYYNPFVLIRVFFSSRYVWKISALLFVALSLYACYLLVQTWKQKLYEDKLGKKRTFSLDYQPYGDAHWAEPCEYSKMAKVRPLSECKGTILGQLTEDCSQCVDMFDPPRMNKHVLAIGSSGSGKSFSLVEPYIVQSVKQRHSIIVTDPKGELYADTAGYLEDHGYCIRRFDLITLSKSDGWDCFRFLRGLKGDELETNAQIFATIVVTNIEAEESVYSRGSIALLKALVLYTILSDTVPEEEKNIGNINVMLQQQGVEYFKSIFGKECKPNLKPAQSAYKTFEQASPNLHGNIVSHLATGMQIIQTSMVEKILSTDEIDLNLPGDKPCAYFCRFSATNNTFRFVSAMFFSMLFISLIDHADRSEHKRLKVPVDFVMDEFPSIGRIPDWLEKISNIRSYGITAVMIVQGMSQIRGIYGDDATMIIGNCGTILNIGMNDEDTAEWFQNRMGVTSIKVSTEQVSGEKAISGSLSSVNRESRGVGKDYLMSVSDIFDMSVDDTIIIFQHCNPIYAHKVPITAFPEFAQSRKKSEKEVPDFDDKEKRQQAREAEEIRIAKYNREHPNMKAVEEEIYEEPVDFAAMNTTEILSLVIQEDIQAVKKWAMSRMDNDSVFRRERRIESAEDGKETERLPFIVTTPVGIYLEEDNDLLSEKEELKPPAPAEVSETENEAQETKQENSAPKDPASEIEEQVKQESPKEPEKKTQRKKKPAGEKTTPAKTQRPTPKNTSFAGSGEAVMPPQKKSKAAKNDN